MNLHQWAIKWGVSMEALRDLQTALGTFTPPAPPEAPQAAGSEARAQSEVRLEAAQKGLYLWRNNVGALKDETGRVIRYGLANDSAALNKSLKSGDLIGWRRVVIRPEHVGGAFAQFVSREIKAPGWQYTGAGRESAQLAWVNLVNSAGGDAAFCTGRGSL